MSGGAIRAEGIRKKFKLKDGQQLQIDGEYVDELTVLDGLDLEIHAGEFISIVGPSGCGKSVFLDIVAGLAPSTEGKVSLDGLAVSGPPERTGYVFQQYALFPWRNARSNIEYPLEVRKVPKAERRKIARCLLSLFGLAQFGDWYPSQLSGGMQQRVAIARSLSTNPDVLLMDEPFAALDAQTREILQGELLRIWEGIGNTVVFVTHSIDEAVFLSDRVVVMTARPGRIKEIIDIDIPHPRDADIRSSPEFGAYRHRVWEALREEVSKAQRDWGLASAVAAD